MKKTSSGPSIFEIHTERHGWHLVIQPARPHTSRGMRPRQSPSPSHPRNMPASLAKNNGNDYPRHYGVRAGTRAGNVHFSTPVRKNLLENESRFRLADPHCGQQRFSGTQGLRLTARPAKFHM
ncbi:hypothetical protein CDEST_08267 [Colletotrichum destructivum]|uniref:Uncharacterized protein n=1 Tax=Colletotrichum destructivum TaxID=34406 RepID=A0AAX4IIE7_9PEZI|nr:hypothetical protein CDEST_08267 [Colletotrichum destructivum]